MYDTHNDILEYAGGDEEFASYLDEANRLCERRLGGLGILDLPDYCWRDAYDDGVSPREALRAALEAM
jgi:hypothetical protein